MYWLPVILALAAGGAHAQLTAQTSIAPELRECYTNVTLLNRNNLPPATIAVLIDIIRQIEDNPNVNMDLRQLATTVLHTYRQDGIEYHQPEGNLALSANVLPFAPTFHSFHRHRLLLTRLIPNNLQIFANDTLSSDLKCAIHHMLSTTVDARLRGDENSCNQLSQYRALRTARQAPSLNDDVEILDLTKLRASEKNGQMQYNPDDDVEYNGPSGGAKSEKQLLGDSTCPILAGVVNTPWGAVSAGNLIAGIAAGAESQRVSVLELTKTSILNYNNIQSHVTSIYPATLSGDLAEAALIQGTERGNSIISVGTAGNWNSTQATKHYMIHSRVNIEMTDPEIRGDIDGFVLGTTLSSALSAYSSLSLSQLLDMYYSPRNGVFDSNLRACNRRQLSQQYLTNDNLAAETYAFAAALDTNMPLRGTIVAGLDQLVSNAVSNLQSYITSNLNDLNCITSETTSTSSRSKTNLYLVLDGTWQYDAIYPAISYLLDSIEVSKFGSSVTLLSAFDGSVIIDKTFSLAQFHSQYTRTRHQSLFTGVNLESTLNNVRTLMHEELRNETTQNYVGGNATVLLYLLNSNNLQINDAVVDQARMLNETVPDLRVIFATSTNHLDSLWILVRDMHDDIKTISLTSDGRNVETNMAEVLSRVQRVGRRVINPLCGPDFVASGTSGTRNFDDFIEPGYINYYTVSPNYFYGNNDNRRVRINRSAGGTGNLIICQSRTVSQPTQNSTISGVTDDAVYCQTLTTGNVEINLQNFCNDYWTIGSCPPLYFSVQSTVATQTQTALCTDNRVCRFPYNIRYQVQIEEFGCFSGVGNIAASVTITAFAVIVTLFRGM